MRKADKKIARRIDTLKSRLANINDSVSRESRKKWRDSTLLRALKQTRLRLKDEIRSAT